MFQTAYQFLILGIIPGTSYQFSFYDWLAVVVGLFALRSSFAVIRRQLVTKLQIVLAFFMMSMREPSLA